MRTPFFISCIPPPLATKHPRPRHLPSMRMYPVKILNGRGSRSTPPLPPLSSTSDAVSSDISANLKSKIQFLYASHVSLEGVDYKAMQRSPAFAAYVAETQRLSKLDILSMLNDDDHKIAFFVNLYNALTQHAVTVLGAPMAASVFRLLFAMGVGYMVGPYRLSLNDMENGILRGNSSVSVLPRPFGKGDGRRALCVETLDARIHFVLNCAAMSCPPVLYLTAENLESSLQMATKGFLGNTDNLEVVGNRVMLSMIFKWYMDDFGGGKGERGVLEWIAEHGDAEQEEVKDVKRILGDFPSVVAVDWKPYDWSLNSV